MLSPRVHLPLVYVLLIWLISDTAFAFNCPDCKKDTLTNCPYGQIYCSECQSYFLLLRHWPSNPRPLFSGDNLVNVNNIGRGIEATNELICHNFNITDPNVFSDNILSNQQILHLTHQIQEGYPNASTHPHFLFAAVALAQIQVFNTPALSDLSSTNQLHSILQFLEFDIDSRAKLKG